ncbi:helix-turn-helix domain-containing protein [Streptomyces sp. V4-01]|uniref:Helix-turn-helix domain-containing protein n=1 Tax=Actinacidiphila polyblastidii TaxID=3110430 RepID=A0ABU7P3G9_9ACTN|nr:helix-turn-helix domain-containing protein [Streptomyces sp. V4-01]
MARSGASPQLGANGVYGYRGSRLDLGRPRRRLELPTGEVTVFVALDQQIRIHDPARPEPRTFTSLINGARSHASVGEHSGRLAGVEVLMAPWAAYRLFGVAMSELALGALDLDEVIGRRARVLAERLHDAHGWGECFAVLDAELTSLARVGRRPDPRLTGAWRDLVGAGGGMAIEDLADRTGWSRRHLDRRFHEQIGLSPKVLARVLRLRRAARLLTEGTAPGAAAARTGFYDQAHLTGEFVRMTGLTPGRFLAERAGGAAGAEPVDRLEHEVTSVVLEA